jgi:beta-galactosidase
MFRSDPQVHIIGHWNYAPGTNKTVYVASNAKDVELFVNNKSLGHGKVSDRYLFTFPGVAWEPGEIKAVASTDGKVVVTQSKHTVGPPVALRLTPITGPGGLRADGSDILLIDVEAVDAKGERCPAFEQRADFDMTGPGTWRGGYNSGRTNSINKNFLNLECGINRVAVRAGRTPGKITVAARCDGLKPGSVTVESQPSNAIDGASPDLPVLPVVALPAQPPTQLASMESAAPSAAQPAHAGRFTKSFSYSGPTGIVHLESDAKDGKNIYVDRDFPFAGLPAELAGADYVQGANDDKLYSAVDLIELAVKPGTVVYIAHDDRLARPDWLMRQFQPTSASLDIQGKPMKLFEHRASHDESLTLGANTESSAAKACNMYLVFVNAATSTH